MKKIVGTLVPMSALYSSLLSENDKGTFAAGIIFLEWLKKTNQSAWQALPLCESQLEEGSSTTHVPSPYKSYGIGLDPKYLPESYASITPTEQEKNDFIADNGDWIDDYALFCALRDHFKTDDWTNWDDGLRKHDANTLSIWKNKLDKQVNLHIIAQWKLQKSYSELKNKAKELGIFLIGDMSFYVSYRSPLVWAHQDVFIIQKDFSLSHVSGIPDSATSRYGRQVWGHPLYDWGNNKAKVIEFWKIRLDYIAKLFDIIRFDHANGFFHYGVLDVKNPENDTVMQGPGENVFEELLKFNHSNGVESFAEDSGKNLNKLRESLQKLDIAGVKILRYAFDEKRGKLNKLYCEIENYPLNSVAYTTTHDTETLLGYLTCLTGEQRRMLAEGSGVSYNPDMKEFAVILRDAVLASPSYIVIVPIQDWLLITDRINVPGTESSKNDPNWHFKILLPIEKLPVRF